MAEVQDRLKSFILGFSLQDWLVSIPRGVTPWGKECEVFPLKEGVVFGYRWGEWTASRFLVGVLGDTEIDQHQSRTAGGWDTNTVKVLTVGSHAAVVFFHENWAYKLSVGEKTQVWVKY
ncbi:hypothetical protein A2473_03655 [candidate division WWE3 bacterium RIFOXYC2_FULL_42_13]|uniref:Uncharacterized protein n=1 Tax=candidate division WWE3 bacterium TaxID=2053526 RepID=A0A3D0ZQW8_UNCKA|nr:MAG: hypothetical protein A2245_04185 [candidate division WWE3 bacterium RIFOXYA2_FULL_43_12]OGC72335.1 MAG: hypothetical protein A2337_03560 [candidate division WWE3 bacterium RIFOXYB2_FULL_43_9]OGC72821.1 MAG: hypothetical protein A2473_03655 [candidate division WWE3 bacterium RIFOXYC2_FULL_42_13]OGC75794.1 MAG: hypothetical protein A2547_00390 [candidate division WWE3 bacterium RIFOXYD2_FULL_43_10]HCC42677.1 hypothetical protein [candidate division WWE3 bacterium]